MRWGNADGAEGREGKRRMVTGIRCTAGQELACRHLVMNRDYSAATADGIGDAPSAPLPCLYRSVLITDAHVFNPAEYRDVARDAHPQQQVGGNIVAIVPPYTLCDEQKCAIYIAQMDNSGAVAPRGKYIINVQMRGKTDAQEQSLRLLERAVEEYVLSSLLLSVEEGEASSASRHVLFQGSNMVLIRAKHNSEIAHNVHLVDDSDSDLSLEDCVQRAHGIFRAVVGNDDEPFLPKMAEPEDSSDMYDEDSRLLGVPQDMQQSPEGSRASVNDNI